MSPCFNQTNYFFQNSFEDFHGNYTSGKVNNEDINTEKFQFFLLGTKQKRNFSDENSQEFNRKEKYTVTEKDDEP